MSSISTVKARICLMAKQIPAPNAIRSAFPVRPRALQNTDLPALVLETADAQYDTAEASETVQIVRRRLLATLYVQPLLQGTEGEAEERVDAFAEAFRSYFTPRGGLELATLPPPRSLPGVRARIVEDTGFIGLYYPITQQTKAYAAVGFTFEVQTWYTITPLG